MKSYFHGLLNKEEREWGGGGGEEEASSVACLSVDWRLSCPVQTTAPRGPAAKDTHLRQQTLVTVWRTDTAAKDTHLRQQTLVSVWRTDTER